MPHTPQHLEKQAEGDLDIPVSNRTGRRSPLEQTPQQRKAAFEAAGVTSADLQEIPEPTVTEEPETDFEQTLQQLESTIGQAERLGDFTTPELTTARRKMIDINERIARHEAEAKRAEEAALQEGRTIGFARGRAAQVRREAAFKALELSAIAQAAQGRFRLAKDLAKEAQSEQFEALEKQIAALRANIIENFDQMTPDQKRRAKATLARLDSQDAFLKTQRETKEAIQNAVFEAVRVRGITDPDIIEDALAQDNPARALALINERVPVVEETNISGLVSAVESGQIGLENVPSDLRREVAEQVDFGKMPIDGDDIVRRTGRTQFTPEELGVSQEEVEALGEGAQVQIADNLYTVTPTGELRFEEEISPIRQAEFVASQLVNEGITNEDTLTNRIIDKTGVAVGIASRAARAAIEEPDELSQQSIEDFKQANIEYVQGLKDFGDSRDSAKSLLEQTLKAQLNVDKLPDEWGTFVDDAINQIYGKKKGFFQGNFLGGLLQFPPSVE